MYNRGDGYNSEYRIVQLYWKGDYQPGCLPQFEGKFHGFYTNKSVLVSLVEDIDGLIHEFEYNYYDIVFKN